MNEGNNGGFSGNDAAPGPPVAPRGPDRFGECEACRKDDDLWVAALPGIAMSCARCKRCLTYAIYPYGVCVANTASIGGMEHAAMWWREVVFTSLAVHDVLPDQFEKDVQKAMRNVAAERQPPGIGEQGAG